jgi:hypothetical protein
VHEALKQVFRNLRDDNIYVSLEKPIQTRGDPAPETPEETAAINALRTMTEEWIEKNKSSLK